MYKNRIFFRKMDEWAEKSGKKSPAFGKPDEKIRGYSKEMH